MSESRPKSNIFDITQADNNTKINAAYYAVEDAGPGFGPGLSVLREGISGALGGKTEFPPETVVWALFPNLALNPKYFDYEEHPNESYYLTYAGAHESSFEYFKRLVKSLDNPTVDLKRKLIPCATFRDGSVSYDVLEKAQLKAKKTENGVLSLKNIFDSEHSQSSFSSAYHESDENHNTVMCRLIHSGQPDWFKWAADTYDVPLKNKNIHDALYPSEELWAAVQSDSSVAEFVVPCIEAILERTPNLFVCEENENAGLRKHHSKKLGEILVETLKRKTFDDEKDEVHATKAFGILAAEMKRKGNNISEVLGVNQLNWAKKVEAGRHKEETAIDLYMKNFSGFVSSHFYDVYSSGRNEDPSTRKAVLNEGYNKLRTELDKQIKIISSFLSNEDADKLRQYIDQESKRIYDENIQEHDLKSEIKNGGQPKWGRR